jgi:hypothetical protein
MRGRLSQNNLRPGSEEERNEPKQLKCQKGNPSRADEQANRNGGGDNEIAHRSVLVPRHGLDTVPGPVAMGEIPVPRRSDQQIRCQLLAAI